MSAVQRIPVVLLTGALGSGKTTLLAAWLRQPELQNAALVVNEIGQVGLDDRTLLPLMQASEGGALLANACICCTGLPGLEEALAQLYRSRLERRIPRFDAVAIETTGLAEPQPVRAAFAADPLLRERYVLRGVVTAVAATAPAKLQQRQEWQAQVRGADLLVITKADRVEALEVAALQRQLAALNPRAAMAASARADFSAAQAWSLLPPSDAAGAGQVHTAPPAAAAHAHHGEPHHHHDAAACFVPLPQAVPRALLAQALQRCIARADGELLRLKGVVLAEDQAPVAVQWSAGDADATLAPFDGAPPAPGLTLIATSREAGERLAAWLQPRA